jgi:hypothetical protein
MYLNLNLNPKKVEEDYRIQSRLRLLRDAKEDILDAGEDILDLDGVVESVMFKDSATQD